MDAPMADEGLDPDLLSSSLFASNIASALADETPAGLNLASSTSCFSHNIVKQYSAFL